MHELTIAQSLLDAISAEAAKQNAKPVWAKISCGAFDAVNDEALRFAFETVAKGTSCEDLKLEIEHKPMQGQCKNCSQTFIIDPTGKIAKHYEKVVAKGHSELVLADLRTLAKSGA